MRGFIASLAVILVLMIAFVVYFFVGGTLSAQPEAHIAEASQQEEAFSAAKDVIDGGLAWQRFSNDVIGGAEGYRLVDVTISLKNVGLFAAEWLEIEVSPAPGDVAVYSISGGATDVPAISRRQANLKLLTRAEPGVTRAVTIRYYVMGMRRSIRVEI